MPLNKFQIHEREASVVKNLFTQLADVQRTAPDYYAHFDDVDSDTATRKELLELMNSAPNECVKYVLFGKYSMRMSLAAAIGRDFV